MTHPGGERLAAVAGTVVVVVVVIVVVVVVVVLLLLLFLTARVPSLAGLRLRRAEGHLGAGDAQR